MFVSPYQSTFDKAIFFADTLTDYDFKSIEKIAKQSGFLIENLTSNSIPSAVLRR